MKRDLISRTFRKYFVPDIPPQASVTPGGYSVVFSKSKLPINYSFERATPLGYLGLWLIPERRHVDGGPGHGGSEGINAPRKGDQLVLSFT